MATRRKKKPAREQVVYRYQLIDWYCPLYVERHPDSTPKAAVILEIHALLDGRFIWQCTYARDEFADGSPAHWRLGVNAFKPNPQENPICNTFAEALRLARAELVMCRIPVWNDAALSKLITPK